MNSEATLLAHAELYLACGHQLPDLQALVLSRLQSTLQFLDGFHREDASSRKPHYTCGILLRQNRLTCYRIGAAKTHILLHCPQFQQF